jgi:hypothetical protein
LSDFFQNGSSSETGKESEFRIVEFNKKIKATIDEWAHSTDTKTDINQWDKLFTPKPPPNCHHKEPCKEFTTKVKGPNTGR